MKIGIEYLAVIFFCLFLSCKTDKREIKNKFVGEPYYSPAYAKGFDIEIADGKFVLKISNPWQHASEVEFEYILTENASKDKSNEIKIPVERVVCLSTTHLAYIDALGKIDAVNGVSGVKNSSLSEVHKRFADKKLFDTGYDSDLSYELIYSLQPDVVFAYGVEGEFADACEKLNSSGIKAVYVGEYLESTPLGKAEWLIPMSLFFGEWEKAVEIFAKIESEYSEAKKLVENVAAKPKVLPNVPYRDVWYLPGKESYMVTFFEDAGADYIFKEGYKRESYPMDLERAFILAQDADFMIIGDRAQTLNELKEIDNRLSMIPAFKNKTIYNNNAKVNAWGGNEFWESGVVNPQIILKDLIKIFRPELMPDYKPVYYRRME